MTMSPDPHSQLQFSPKGPYPTIQEIARRVTLVQAAEALQVG